MEYKAFIAKLSEHYTAAPNLQSYSQGEMEGIMMGNLTSAYLST